MTNREKKQTAENILLTFKNHNLLYMWDME